MKESRFFFLAFLILAIVICLAFGPCFFAGFLNWDDPDHFLINPRLPLHGLQDVLSLFTTPNSVGEGNGLFIPLTVLSWGIERSFFGFNPFVFHLDNILLHIISAFLFLVLGCRMGLSRTGAFLAALIFAVHPMRVESVAWATERKDVLSCAFYLGALVLYWDYVKSSQGQKYVFALLCGIASILAKPMALSLPLVFFLFDWMARRRWTVHSLLDKLPFTFTLWPVAAITMILHGRVVSWNPLEALLLGTYSASFYVTKFFFPFDMLPVRLIPAPISLQNPQYALAILALLGIAGIWYLFRRNRWVVFSFLFYILSIFFLWRVDTYERILVAERFMYIPSMGFCLLIGAFLDHWFLTTRLAWNRGWITVSLLCVLLAGMTFHQCFVWQDSLVFWNTVVSRNSSSPRVFYNRAECLLNDSQIPRRHGLSQRECYQMAVEDLKHAIQIKEDYWEAWHNLGCALGRLDHIKEADAALAKAKDLRKTVKEDR